MKTLTVLAFGLAGILTAQTAQTDENAARMAAGSAPIYRVTVTQRSAKAISYRHRGGATKIDFAGTVLMPSAHGEAKVESKQGYIEVEVEFRDMPAATGFGDEYLTYVLWAITPEGRTSNLGEVLRNGTSGKLDVTTQLQEFGLIVTAEPYFAVSRPSDVVVMENVVRADTLGKVELIDAKYELLERGQYKHLTNGAALGGNAKMPLEMFEARNAIRIARASGADRFATDTFEKAEGSLRQAETYFARNPGSKPVVMTARQAVQVAEDARAIAVKRQDDDLLAAERSASADRELQAEKSRSAAQLETERIARAAADARTQADAKAAAALAEANRLKAANDAQNLAAKAEADRLKTVNDAKLSAAQAELDRAAKASAQAEAEKTALRAQLLAQFSAILQTRDTARGLVVNMSDVLFDSGKFSLRPEAREKLARVAGIVSSHPALHLEVEGHTDNVGTDAYNQDLSEHRGSAVRDYLTQQGQMPQTAVTTKGFGKTQPVASNDTPSGRQQNRRVELVISGEVIGTAIGTPVASK
jgi:outer membrane protein OmpA-like peptidoglycan-associated protein